MANGSSSASGMAFRLTRGGLIYAVAASINDLSPALIAGLIRGVARAQLVYETASRALNFTTDPHVPRVSLATF